jgi:chromosomal replication initiation ATPase DnaA
MTTKQIIAQLQVRGLLELLDDVCVRRGVTRIELCGHQRSQAVVAARHELWWLMREHPERYYSYPEIARLFGKDHTTVWQGVAAHRRRHPPAQDLLAQPARAGA